MTQQVQELEQMLNHAKLNMSGGSFNIANALSHQSGRTSVRIAMKPPEGLYTPARVVQSKNPFVTTAANTPSALRSDAHGETGNFLGTGSKQ